MTYYVTALQNTKGKLIEKTMQTDDKMTAECIADIWESEGYIIVRREEG